MKKFCLTVLVIGLLIGGFFGAKKIYTTIRDNKRMAEIKKGWHVEILEEFVNIREEPYRYSFSPGIVNKGEVYEVLEINLDDPNFYWYKIQIDRVSTGWIANNTSGTFLKDINNPNDVAIPIIKFKENEYKVLDISKINYDHLIVWDDKDDYVITHKVYKEYDRIKDEINYWVKYTITDKSGKFSSKTQKVIFETFPDDSEVEDWADYTRD